MRIATWNLESARGLSTVREAAFRQAMAQVDADVWVLTETWADLAPPESHALATLSDQAADLRKTPGRSWVAVWARSVLAASPQPVRSQPDRMACCRIETSGCTDIVVAGTVLPWASDKLWPGSSGFRAALKAQASEWGELRGAADTSTLLVASDFNQSLPHQKWYGSGGNEAALNDVFRELDLVCVTVGNVAGTDRPRIDHICVSKGGPRPPQVRQVGGWAAPSIKGKPITDHVGVYADIDWWEPS